MKIPMCEHILHIHCLKKWLIDFQKCPVCESNIVRLPQSTSNQESIIKEGGEREMQQLHSAPGLADFEAANQGKDPRLDQIISPKSYEVGKTVAFSNHKNKIQP